MGTCESTLRVVGRTWVHQQHLPCMVAGASLTLVSLQPTFCEAHLNGKDFLFKHHDQVPMPPRLRGRAQQQVLINAPELKERQLMAENKRNIVLLGLTGVGKSTLANALTKSNHFVARDSFASVTSKVDYKDVVRYRVIDTPGFFDTTMSPEDVGKALQEFSNIACEGIAAIVIVVRSGRITEENEAVIKFIEGVLGTDALKKYGIMVVTHTRKSTQDLYSEVMSLPEDNLGRQLAQKLDGRIIGVEKPGIWAGFRSGHPQTVLKQVDQLFAQNEHKAVDCDMMHWDRVKDQLQREFEENTLELRQAHERDREVYVETAAKLEQEVAETQQQIQDAKLELAEVEQRENTLQKLLEEQQRLREQDSDNQRQLHMQQLLLLQLLYSCCCSCS